MFERMIEDIKDATGAAARRTVLIACVAASLFVTTGFLSAAAFVFMLERKGLIYACLTGAGIFFLVTLISAGSYLAMKSPAKKRNSAKDDKPSAGSYLPDPMMLATGLQVIRAIGVKRLLPVLAIAGIVLGVMAARGSSDGDSDAGA